MKAFGLFDGIFWGTVLILLGVWFILRRWLPFTIPLGRIIVAVLFIYAGVRVLVLGPSLREGNTALFSQSRMSWGQTAGRGEYNVIFGSGEVDLSPAEIGESSVGAEVNVIFGSGVLRVKPSAPVRIHMSSAFGSIRAPNGRSVAFGDAVYTTPGWKQGAPALEVRAAAVFGSLRIVE